MDKEMLKGNVPTLILSVLQDGPLHGYAIAREIERRSGAALTFKEGTLYPALHALESGGFIEANWETTERGPARKTYRMTPAGNDDLKRRRALWSRFTQAMVDVMGGSPEAAKGGANGTR
jgi:PadR family transcriptional regulator, regulatory protein PadR